jgi:hypothetical protein
MEGYFAYGECCEADSMSELIEPHLFGLQKDDAHCGDRIE